MSPLVYEASRAVLRRRALLLVVLFVLLAALNCGSVTGRAARYGGWAAFLAPLPSEGALRLLLGDALLLFLLLFTLSLPFRPLRFLSLLPLFGYAFALSLVQGVLMAGTGVFPSLAALLRRLPRHLLGLGGWLWAVSAALEKRNRAPFVEWVFCVMCSAAGSLLDAWLGAGS